MNLENLSACGRVIGRIVLRRCRLW